MINDTPSPIAYICRLRLFKMGFFFNYLSNIWYEKCCVHDFRGISIKKASTNLGRGDPVIRKQLWSEDVVLSNICGPSTRIFRGAIPPVNKTYKCWNNRYKNLHLLSPFPKTQNPIGRTLSLLENVIKIRTVPQ